MAQIKYVDILNEVADTTKLNRKTVKKVIDALVDELWLQLDKENSVQIQRLGVFSTKKYNPKYAKDPRTGELIEGISYKIPKFKFAVSLRKYLKWGGSDD